MEKNMFEPSDSVSIRNFLITFKHACDLNGISRRRRHVARETLHDQVFRRLFGITFLSEEEKVF